MASPDTLTRHRVDLDAEQGSSSTSPGLRGYVARPAGDGPWPGVVVVHEIFGVDEVMRRQVDRLAAAGYLAIMPDLFSAGGALRCLRGTFAALSAGTGRPFHDIDAARRWLLSRPDCTGKVGVIGFCMGGGFALLSSTNGYDVASVNYGQVPKDAARVLRGACPIIASYGGKDQGDGAADLERALTAADVEHDVKNYPDAGHAFLNDAPVGPLLMRPIMRVAHVGPEPASAADAWRRIEEYFAVHLS